MHTCDLQQHCVAFKHEGFDSTILASLSRSCLLFLFPQNLIRQSTDVSEDQVRKSMGGVGDFLRMEENEETPAARDTVSNFGGGCRSGWEVSTLLY